MDGFELHPLFIILLFFRRMHPIGLCHGIRYACFSFNASVAAA